MICFGWQSVIVAVILFILGVYCLVRYVLPYFLRRKIEGQVDNLFSMTMDEVDSDEDES